MTLGEYITVRLGKSWAICRATKANRAKYGVCVSEGRYAQLAREYARDNPDMVGEWSIPSRILAEIDKEAAVDIAAARSAAIRRLYGPPDGGQTI